MNRNWLLTSKEARQYQQKTCLHRLHIICAHPSSFSIGTLHIGQHLIKSELKLSPGSIKSERPSFSKRLEFSSHVSPWCHEFLQFEQNSDAHVGQWTDVGAHFSRGHTVQTVSQPARGHHVRVRSMSTSWFNRNLRYRSIIWRVTKVSTSATVTVPCSRHCASGHEMS